VFGISGTELFIIVAFALIILGPDRLPEIGRTLGRFMREFKRAQDSMEAVIRAEMYGKGQDITKTPEKPGSPLPNRKIDDDDDEEEEEED